jgi:DnaJ-class molecular chaperone
VFYVVSLYVWPFRPCPRCAGKGTNRGSTRKRHGDCGRCGGSRRVQRRGSKFVHGTVLSIASERRKARERRGKERGKL